MGGVRRKVEIDGNLALALSLGFMKVRRSERPQKLDKLQGPPFG